MTGWSGAGLVQELDFIARRVMPTEINTRRHGHITWDWFSRSWMTSDMTTNRSRSTADIISTLPKPAGESETLPENTQ